MGSLPILPTISTSFIVISAILVAIGWYFIRQKQVEKHEKTMWLAAAFALAFFIIYLSRTIFIGNTSFGGPDHLKIYYTLFLFFHIFLATAGAVFGTVTLLSAVKKIGCDIKSSVQSQASFGFSPRQQALLCICCYTYFTAAVKRHRSLKRF